MKANEAPEKIYLQVCGDCTLNDKETCEQCHKDNPINNGREVTWCVDKIFDKDVEYTRTDAFIERVINFLNRKLDDVVATRVFGTLIPHHVAKQELIEDFKNYMKGE